MHIEVAVTFVLSFFEQQFRLISKSQHIKKIETDFSLVLLKSACYAFNKINLYDYMNIIFNEAEGKKSTSKDLTILHICVTSRLEI